MLIDYNKYIDSLIELAISEDIGDGDHTSLSTIPLEAKGRMKLLVKQEGIIAGIEVAKRVFKRLEPNIIFEQLLEDGAMVSVGDIAFYVEGRVISLLQSERIVLNIMQRMSGVATKTKRYVNMLSGLNTKVLDTRKTTPGMRVLDKQAVKIGGGENHRMGLFDMVMIKDNHIDFAGGITPAVNKCVAYCLSQGKESLKIEVETRSIADVHEAIATGKVDRIMLDNFSIDMTREAVVIIRQQERYIEIESSGGITIDTMRSYAECGVDFVSVGALTHQIESLDMSLKAV